MKIKIPTHAYFDPDSGSASISLGEFHASREDFDEPWELEHWLHGRGPGRSLGDYRRREAISDLASAIRLSDSETATRRAIELEEIARAIYEIELHPKPHVATRQPTAEHVVEVRCPYTQQRVTHMIKNEQDAQRLHDALEQVGAAVTLRKKGDL